MRRWLGLLIISFFLFGILSYYSGNGVKISKLDKKESTTVVLDRKGRVIRYLNNAQGTFSTDISLEQIPVEMQKIFLLAEDRRFYTHLGIDFVSLGRALWQNFKRGEIVSGASTIEQQLARIINRRPRSFLGKIQVLNDALWIALAYDKREVLESYFNLLPFGHNMRGIWEASNYFFGKEPKALSLSEIAILATLPRAPSRLLQSKNRKELSKKKNQILEDYFHLHPEMAHLKKISLAEKNEIVFQRQTFNAPHFIQFLLSQCDKTCKDNREIRTGLDLELQEDIQNITKTHINRLADKGVGTASVIVVDNQTGEILSYVGSHDFFNKEFGQNDGVLQKRQPGSTLKPLTYAFAFKHDHHPGSILPDIETMFNVGGGVYKPRNYSNNYLGPVRASFALSNSLNIPALYLVDYYGVQDVLAFYRSFGFDFPKSSEIYGIGITLGNAEVSLHDLVRAYTAFPNGGPYLDLTPFRRLGKVQKQTSMNSPEAKIIAKILSDSFRREHSFGRNSYLDFPFWFASKTGTSTNFRDNWVVGFNERFTVGVWAGNFDQSSMYNVSGVSGAGPIYHDIVKQVYAYFSREPMMTMPLAQSESLEICPLSGMLKSKNCPHSFHEHFLSNKKPTKKCDVHRAVLVRNCKPEQEIGRIVVEDFSNIYNMWKEENNILSVEDQVSLQCSTGFKVVSEKRGDESSYVEIKSPVDGSLYGVDPNIPTKYQKLSFEVVAEDKITRVRWYLENKFLGESNSTHGFLWPLSRGKKTLKAEVKFEDGKTVVRNSTFNVL